METGLQRAGSAVLVVDARGRILLQQRDDDVPPAGYGRWTIPGGKGEGDESPRETAVREFEEETSVRLRQLRYWGDVTPQRAPGWRAERSHLYISVDDVPAEAITVGEGLDFRYWHPVEVESLPMNPPIRGILRDLLDGSLYRWAAHRPGASVVALSRWGEALVCRAAGAPHWSLPSTALGWDDAPDAAALRAFDDVTGVRLERLSLFELVRDDVIDGLPARALHVYFDDADLDPATLGDGSTAFTYVHPDRLDSTPLEPWVAALLERFFASTHYRALFH